MTKRDWDGEESKLRERLMKERWRLTAEQELPYASNKEIADEKIGKWLSAALEDPTTCGAMKDDINEWFRAVEEERLRSKKKFIHDELWETVKMEMFKASSKLEGIDYDKINRVEVIDETGRGYVKYLKDGEGVRYALQDDNRTLKIFIDTLTATHELDRIENTQEVPCKTHPDAPHGFDRNASLSMDRYVCECEYWEPDWEPEDENDN